MRPIWSGYISFSLVTIPVSLYSAEKQQEHLHTHLLDSRDKSRIRYQRINENTGKEVPWDKIIKGYEYSKDNYILLKEEDFKKASTAAKTVAIENFVKLNELDYEYFERPYFLVAEKNGGKSYALLREALKNQGKIGIAKIYLHEKEHLAAIIPSHDALILDILRFKSELRTPSELNLPENRITDFKISSKEMLMAKQLIESMTEKWHPEKYHDEYHEDLMAWIDKKAKGKTIKEKVVPFKPRAKADNLVELMKKSIESMQKKKKKT